MPQNYYAVGCMFYRSAGAGAVLFILMLIASLQGLRAQSLEITGKEIECSAGLEYNRSFSWGGNFFTSGAAGINNRYAFKGGLGLGGIGKSFEIKVFSSGKAALLPEFPLFFCLNYLYHGLPGQAFDVHTHSVLPYISLEGRWAGFAAGNNFRFTRFLGETTVFEPVLSFWGYVNFINKEKIRIGLGFGNFGDFYTGNLGSLYLKAGGIARVDNKWSVTGEVELLQSGIDGLTASFYGIAFRGGVKYAW